jgi:hypothetical protein
MDAKDASSQALRRMYRQDPIRARGGQRLRQFGEFRGTDFPVVPSVRRVGKRACGRSGELFVRRGDGGHLAMHPRFSLFNLTHSGCIGSTTPRLSMSWGNGVDESLLRAAGRPDKQAHARPRRSFAHGGPDDRAPESARRLSTQLSAATV